MNKENIIKWFNELDADMQGHILCMDAEAFCHKDLSVRYEAYQVLFSILYDNDITIEDWIEASKDIDYE